MHEVAHLETKEQHEALRVAARVLLADAPLARRAHRGELRCDTASRSEAARSVPVSTDEKMDGDRIGEEQQGYDGPVGLWIVPAPLCRRVSGTHR